MNILVQKNHIKEIFQMNIQSSVNIYTSSVGHVNSFKSIKQKLDYIMQLLHMQQTLVINHTFVLNYNLLNFILALDVQEFFYKLEDLAKLFHKGKYVKGQYLSHFLLGTLANHICDSLLLKILLSNCTSYLFIELSFSLPVQKLDINRKKKYEAKNIECFSNRDVLFLTILNPSICLSQHSFSNDNIYLLKKFLTSKQPERLDTESEMHFCSKLKSLIWTDMNYLKRLSCQCSSYQSIKFSVEDFERFIPTELIMTKEKCLRTKMKKDHQKRYIKAVNIDCTPFKSSKTSGNSKNEKLNLPVRDINDKHCCTFVQTNLITDSSVHILPTEKTTAYMSLSSISKDDAKIEGIGVVKILQHNYCFVFCEDLIFLHKSYINDLPCKIFSLTEVLSVGQKIKITALICKNNLTKCRWKATSAWIYYSPDSEELATSASLLPMNNNGMTRIDGHSTSVSLLPFNTNGMTTIEGLSTSLSLLPLPVNNSKMTRIEGSSTSVSLLPLPVNTNGMTRIERPSTSVSLLPLPVNNSGMTRIEGPSTSVSLLPLPINNNGMTRIEGTSTLVSLLPLPVNNGMTRVEGYGVVQVVKENYSLLMHDNCKENFVFIHIDCIQDLPHNTNDLRQILYLQQNIKFHAVPNIKQGARCKWKATSAWIRPQNTWGHFLNTRQRWEEQFSPYIGRQEIKWNQSCSTETSKILDKSDSYENNEIRSNSHFNRQICQNMKTGYSEFKRGTGRFHHVLSTEGLIIDSISNNEIICVAKNVTYKNGKKISSFQELDHREIVHYCAFLNDQFCMFGYQWKAIVAWVGKILPNGLDMNTVFSKEITNSTEKLYKEQYEEIYKDIMPEIDVSDRPVVVLKSSC